MDAKPLNYQTLYNARTYAGLNQRHSLVTSEKSMHTGERFLEFIFCCFSPTLFDFSI